MTTAERYSPLWLVERARAVMGGIDLDPASSPLANETVQAAHYYTREEDGLARRWWGRGYVNPPFGPEWRHWIRKLSQELRAERVTQAMIVGQGSVLWAMLKPWFGMLLRGSFLIPYHPIRFYDPASGKWVTVRYDSFVCYLGVHHYRFALAFRDRGTILRSVCERNDDWKQASEDITESRSSNPNERIEK